MLRPGPAAGDADVLLVINGNLDDAHVTLPPRADTDSAPWQLVWDSSWDFPFVPEDEAGPRTSVTLDALSLQVLLSQGG